MPKKIKGAQVNSLAYCAQAVHEEAQAMASGGVFRKNEPVKAPFTLEELKAYLSANAHSLRQKTKHFTNWQKVWRNSRRNAEKHYADLEQLEQRLTALEEKMSAIAKTTQSEEALFEARRQLDATLRPYRGKMTADQLQCWKSSFWRRALLESAGLPRLSLFYLV